jgi:hypothetical protein
MTINAAFTRRKTLGRLLRDTRGITLPLVALALTALIGFTGLGVETGLWYTIKRHDQSAADFAALSGAMELAAGQPYLVTGPPPAGICGLSQRVAAQNGFTFVSFTCPGASPACTNPASGKMCVNNPPVLGALAGDPTAVEVILSQQQNALFASLSLPNVTINARAVAKVQNNGISCSTALNPTIAPGISFQGTTTVSLNCSFAANSNSPDAIDVSGNTTLNANSLWTVGNWSTNGNPSITLSSGAFTQQYPVVDPYAGRITYTKPTNSTCTNWTTLLPTGSGTLSPLPAGQFYCPMSFGNGNTVTLAAGVYLINGQSNNSPNYAIHVQGTAVVTGNGVTIIATGTGGTGGSATNSGSIDIQGGTVTLVAPTSSLTPPGGGTVPSGLIFYQDRSVVVSQANKANSTITATASNTFTGVIYAPAKNVTFTGNSTSSGCTVVIADTMTFTGTSSSISATQSACQAAGVSAPTVLSLGLAE